MTISVIIPVYNVSRYLSECLDSLLAQTYTEWEAVCIDDGSTDGSGAILDAYAVKDSRFRVIHQTNAGVSAARNVGIRLAQGDWVGFLDSDDTVGTSWLSSYVRGMEGVCDIVMGGVEQNGERRISYRQDMVAIALSGGVIAEYDLLLNYFMYSRMFRARFLKDNHFELLAGMDISEDALFNLQALAKAKSVSLVTGEHYHYRSVQGSLSRQLHAPEMYARNAQLYADYLSELEAAHPLPPAYARYVRYRPLLSLKLWALRSALERRLSSDEVRTYMNPVLLDAKLFIERHRGAHLPRRIWARCVANAPVFIQVLLLKLAGRRV